MKMPKNNENVLLALKHLLQDEVVSTQTDIRLALAKLGFKLNQVRISRLLHKIGAAKTVEGKTTVYRLPNENLATISANDTLQNLILSIEHNNTLIVIQTAPGSAHLVARMLDLKKDLGILGTIAGDDTIFVAPKKEREIVSVYKKVYQLLLS